MEFDIQISSHTITTVLQKLGIVFAVVLLVAGSLGMQVHVAFGGYAVTHEFLGDYPGGENDWGNDLQGIAHDEGHWFITMTETLRKYPVSADLAELPGRLNPAVGELEKNIQDYTELVELGLNHFGDLDQWQGLLFIPIEGGGRSVLGVFDASDLSLVYFKDLTWYQSYYSGDTKDSHFGWLAINHQQSIMYTSGETASSLIRYDLDTGLLKLTRDLDQSLTFKDSFPLLESDGSQVGSETFPFTCMQGGVFSPFGDLYLINGFHTEPEDRTIVNYRGGIHMFDTTGRLITESTKGSGSFRYDYSPNSPNWEEPEGIDWWNLDPHPGLTSPPPGITGQLHVIMTDNDQWRGMGTDDLYLKHYQVTYTIPPDDSGRPRDSDGDGHTDWGEVYLDNTEPLIARPHGSMTIKWMGREDIAKGQGVTLYMTSYDETSDIYGERPSLMRFSDQYTDWTEWERYNGLHPWSLQGDRGYKEVWCQVENKAGLWSAAYCDFSDGIFFTKPKSTDLFFNINPNPAIEHEPVELKGIVIDKEGNPVPPSRHTDATGYVQLSYSSGGAWDWTPYLSLPVYQDGTFSTTIVESPELDLSGAIIFRASYIAGDDYFDSEAQTLLRFVSTEVWSPESSTSLYFNLWLTATVKGWPVGLKGCLRDETGSPKSDALVTVYNSVDDGASWQFEENQQTDQYGIFNAQIETDAFGPSSPLAEPQPVLIRVGHIIGVSAESVMIYKTAYLTVGTDWHLERLYPVVQIQIPHMPIPLRRVMYMPYEIQTGLPTTAGYDVRFIDETSLRLNGTVPVGPECISYRDINSDGLLDLTLTMNRTVLSQFILSRNMTTGNVTLLLTGRFYDNVMFGGPLIVKVRMPGDINIDGKVDIKDVAEAATTFGSYNGGARWDPNADESEDGRIDIRDLVMICKKFGTKYT